MADEPSPGIGGTLLGAAVAALVAGAVLIVLTGGDVGSGPLRVVVAVLVGVTVARVVETRR
jgi:hypothetical protein